VSEQRSIKGIGNIRKDEERLVKQYNVPQKIMGMVNEKKVKTRSLIGIGKKEKISFMYWEGMIKT